MPKLQGSITEKNLLVSFSGEGQARNRYTYWAAKAKKEGFEQIAYIFSLTADQEKEHAERFFKFMEAGELAVTGLYPTGIIGTTLANLQEAAAGEHFENSELYPAFANIAESEGFQEISDVYRAIIVAEKAHEKRYLELADRLLTNTVFSSVEPIKWQCRNCGYTIYATEPPAVCPSCNHARAYFERMMNNL